MWVLFVRFELRIAPIFLALVLKRGGGARDPQTSNLGQERVARVLLFFIKAKPRRSGKTS